MLFYQPYWHSSTFITSFTVNDLNICVFVSSYAVYILLWCCNCGLPVINERICYVMLCTWAWKHILFFMNGIDIGGVWEPCLVWWNQRLLFAESKRFYVQCVRSSLLLQCPVLSSGTRVCSSENILFETLHYFSSNFVTLLSKTWFRINQMLRILTFMVHCVCTCK